jgi:hypothetical protein
MQRTVERAFGIDDGQTVGPIRKVLPFRLAGLDRRNDHLRLPRLDGHEFQPPFPHPVVGETANDASGKRSRGMPDWFVKRSKYFSHFRNSYPDASIKQPRCRPDETVHFRPIVSLS